MKNILKSAVTILAMGGLLVGASIAFFSDEETSLDNTFTAGAIDLKVDFEGYYNKLADGDPNAGSWAEKDLTTDDIFFDFDDLKPGDFGEGTISLHVYTNDAWGRMVIDNVLDSGVDCTEPETETTDPDCMNLAPDTAEADGELRENLTFWAWLDQGTTPGFQGEEDEGEGDNLWQENSEPIMITEGTIDQGGETHNFWEGLSAYRAFLGSTCNATDPDGDGQTGFAGDESTYLLCQGLAIDGRMVGSTTYYMGIAWELPETVGNDVQSDTLQADVTFEVMQHRNVPTPFP